MAPDLDCRNCPSAKGSGFACLAPAQRSRLAKVAAPHAYSRGQTIFYEGNPSLAVFCVRSGLVKLTRQVSHGNAVVVALQRAGDIFGCRAVLAERPYAMSAQTVEPSVVCAIPREDFLALLKESHALALNLLKSLATAYRFAEELLVERSGERVATRTARFLVRLAKGASVQAKPGASIAIPTRREDLTMLVGTTPETLSRTLHALAKRGLVGVNRKEISVRDLAGLRKLAE